MFLRYPRRLGLYLCAVACLSLSGAALAANPWESYDRDMTYCIEQISPGFMNQFFDMAAGGERRPMPAVSVDEIAKCMSSRGYKPSSIDDFSMYQSFVSEALENPEPEAIEELKAKYQIGPAPQAKTRPPVSAIVPNAAMSQPKVYVFPNDKGKGKAPSSGQNPIFNVPQ